MKSTPNYNLVKQELTDAADITQISGNWDKLDTTLKNLDDNKFNKTGGTISGQVTVTGRSNFYSVQVTDTETVGGTLTVGGKVTANGGLGVSGGATVDSLTATGDVTVNGKINTDNIRARGTALNAGVTMSGSDFVGVIAQVVSGTTPRISVSHHPDKTSNDKQIATTNWVKSLTATTSEYGLVKVADETALLSESNDAALTVDKAYELNDFRRMSTAYAVGDKVNCAFNFGLFLECTKAGTTGATTLDTRSVTHGQVITDGTCQWTVRTHVKSVNGNVPDANGNIQIETVNENVIKTMILNMFFPVGSVYMSANKNFNPNTSWGGTWVKIENRFLLGSGTKAVGATGGEETHTLTVNEIPSHNHGGTFSGSGTTSSSGSHTHYLFANTSSAPGANDGIMISPSQQAAATAYANNYLENYTIKGVSNSASVGRSSSAGSHTHSFSVSGSINSQGGGAAHNNMPPYEVVAIWKRTA